MLIGPSGAGKSALALELIGLGAALVSDDLTRVSADAGGLRAHVPAKMADMIEARGLGLIRVPSLPEGGTVPVRLVVDLAQVEDQRLPPSRPVTFVAKHPIRTVWRVDGRHFPSALFYMVKFGVFGDDLD